MTGQDCCPRKNNLRSSEEDLRPGGQDHPHQGPTFHSPNPSPNVLSAKQGLAKGKGAKERVDGPSDVAQVQMRPPLDLGDKKVGRCPEEAMKSNQNLQFNPQFLGTKVKRGTLESHWG